jgi:SAM-dependent methyltransferase
MRLLATADGETFEQVGPVGIVDPRMVSCRSLFAWRDRLYFTSAGARGTQGNETSIPGIFASDDPGSGDWRLVSPPNIAGEGNKAVAELVDFNDHLYAATLNPSEGFQLWKTRGEGEPPYRWTRVLSAGAYRGYLNEAAMSMCAYGDALYLGTCIAGGGYNRYRKIGPAAGEVIRVYPDDTWDLVVGFPRLTPDGVKMPLSGLGPGFNYPLAGYIWQICAHDEWLYVGTYNAASWFPYLPMRIPEEVLQMVQIEDTVDLAARFGGCHLWRSHDGERFTPVTTDGFGCQYNYGVRQLRSTPYGLVVGTANPFGPDVGVRRDGTWTYEPNPRGGLEIWLGHREPNARAERLPAPRSQTTAVRRQREALARMAQSLLRTVYDQLTDRFYDGSGFSQMGYWRACGRGATTAVLASRFSQSQIVATDVIQLDLDFARRLLPGATFRQMESTALDFESCSFDNVMCVEKACYFGTRRNFLKEAHRLLAPGGRLVLSDILYSRTGEALCLHRFRENHLPDAEAYERLLTRLGFDQIEIVDATATCADAYLERITGYLKEQLANHEISLGHFNTLYSLVSVHLLFLRSYLLVAARKP